MAPKKASATGAAALQPLDPNQLNTLLGSLLRPWRSCSKRWTSTFVPDNDFCQRREEAFRFSEMTRGFGGRSYPRHVRSIHNSTQNDDKGSQQNRPQCSSQASGQQQTFFRPPAPRGRGARGFGGRFGDQPRRIFCLFCSENKGHTTRMCHVTIQKQKEIAEAASQ